MAAPVLVSSHTAYRGALTIAGDGGLVDLGFMLLAVGSSTPTSWSITLTSGTSGHWTTPTDGTFPTPTSTGDTADLNGGPYVFDVTATNVDGTSNTCVLTINIRADTYSISSNADVSAARGTAGPNNTTLCGKTLEVVRACTGFTTVGAGRLYLSRHNATATNSSRLTITNEDNEYPAEIECIQVENSNAVTINDTYTTATASAQAHHLHFNQNDFFTGETCGDIVVNRPVIRGPAGEVTNTKNGIYVHPACDGSFIFRDVDMTWVTNGIGASPQSAMEIYGGKVRYFTSNGLQVNAPTLTIHDIVIMSPMRNTSNNAFPGQDHVDFIQLSDNSEIVLDMQRVWLVQADGNASCTTQSGTAVMGPGVMKNIVSVMAAEGYSPMIQNGNNLEAACFTSINQTTFPNLTTTATTWGDKYTPAGAGGGEPWVRFHGTQTAVTIERVWVGNNVGGPLTGVTLGDGILEWQRYAMGGGGVQAAYAPSLVFQDYAALSTIDYESPDTDGIIAALRAALSPIKDGPAKLSDNGYSTSLYPDGGDNLMLPYATKYTLSASVASVEADGSVIITANLLDAADASAVRGVDLVITLTEGGASGNTGTYQIAIPAGESSGQVTATDAGTGTGSWTFTATTPTDLTDPAALDVPVTGGSMALNDTFTATDGTLLTARNADSGQAWTALTGNFVIASNRIRANTSTVVVQNEWTPAAAEYDIEADFYVHTTITQSAFIAARIQDSTNYVVFGWLHGTGWTIGHTVAGAFTNNNSSGATLSAGTSYHLKAEVRNGTKRLYVDGVLKCSTTANNITPAGKVGFRNSGGTPGDATGYHWDNLTAADLVATQDLTPSLFTNSQTFHAPAVTATYALAPALVTNTQTFFAPTVSGGGGGGGSTVYRGGFGQLGLVMGL